MVIFKKTEILIENWFLFVSTFWLKSLVNGMPTITTTAKMRMTTNHRFSNIECLLSSVRGNCVKTGKMKSFSPFYGRSNCTVDYFATFLRTDK